MKRLKYDLNLPAESSWLELRLENRMLPLLRFWVGLLTSLALMGLSLALLTSEINFVLNSVSSTATVEHYTHKKLIEKLGLTFIGRGGGRVVHKMGGQPVRATFESYYFRRGPEKGEQLPVLYLPTEPGFVKINSFVQLYVSAVFPLVLAFISAYWSGILRRRGTRKELDPTEPSRVSDVSES